jgi:ATP-dependent RNA helicase DOB1
LTPKAEELPPHEQYIIDVLLNCALGSTVQDRANVVATPSGVQPCAPNQKGVPLVVPVLLSTIEGISHLRIHLPQDLRSEQARETVWKSVLEVHRRMPDGVPLVDPIENMGIKDVKFKELVKVCKKKCVLKYNNLCSTFFFLENRSHGTEDDFKSSA